jgi:hypothetical protein
MTDDEINRKVAEIEGWVLFDGIWAHAEHCPRSYDHCPPYATDWAWCGPLIGEYTISLEAIFEDGAGTVGWEAYCDGSSQTSDSPQRAICLAVIAAHDRPTTSGHWTGLGDK